MVDVATLALTMDTTGLETGVKQVDRALNSLEQRISKTISQAQAFQQKISQAFTFSGGPGARVGQQTAIEQATLRHTQRLAELEARREIQAQRHQQKLIEIETQGAARRASRQNQELSSLQTFLRRHASTIREAGESIQAAGISLIGLSAGAIAIGRASIEAAGKIEAIRRGLQTLDKDRSGETFARLKEQADKLTVSFTGYAQQVIRVRSTQKLTADESERLTIGLINVARQVGASTEQQGRAITALNQILSKGRIQAEELRGQLFEAIPNLAPIIEKRFGTLQAEVLEKRFGVRKFVSGLIDELSRLNKLEPTALEKFQVSLENFSIKLAPVGERVLNLLNKNLDPLLKTTERLITRFEQLSPAMQENIIKFGLLAAAAGPLVFTLGSVIQTLGALGNLITVFGGTAATGGAAALGGLGASALAVVPFLAAAGAAWYTYSQGVERSINSIDRSLERSRRQFEERRAEVQRSLTVDFGNAVPVDPKTGKRIELKTSGVDLLTGQPIAPKIPTPTTGTGGGAAARAQTEFERLNQRLKETQKHVALLRDTTSKEFAVKIKLDTAEAFERDLERILELRRELSQPIGAVLPATARGAAAEVERLNALRTALDKLSGTDALGLFKEGQANAIQEQANAFKELYDQIVGRSPEAREATAQETVAKALLTDEYKKLNEVQRIYLQQKAKEVDASIKAAAGDRQFAGLREQLTGRLARAQELNAAQTLQLELQTDKYKDLTQAQKDQLSVLAEQVDRQNEFNAQLETVQQATREFHSILVGSFETLFLDGPKRFFEQLLNTLKRTLARMLSEILASEALKLLGIVPGGATRGGITGGGFGGFASQGAAGGLGGLLGGGFLTGGFAGGNPAGAILGGGGIGSQGGAFSSILSRIPGLGRIFGAGAAVRTPDFLLGGDTGAGGGFSPIPAGGGGIFAGLGAGGLLLGGGLLGGLLGGRSQIGRLAGSIGGTLGLGVLGATGIFGSGIAGALPALFSNPFTAIAAGALIGVSLLSGLFANRDLKDYRKHVLNEYAVDVKANKALEQIREIGKAAFGKDYKSKRIETVRLPQSRELVYEYAQRTGQKGNSKLFSAAALQDPFNEMNRFVVRRAFGGFLRAFQPAIVGDGGKPEVIMPTTNSFVFPSIRDFAAAQMRPAPIAVQQTSNRERGYERLMIAVLVDLQEAVSSLKAVPKGHIIEMGLAENPEAAARAVAASFRRRSEASSEIRNNVYQR